MTSEQNPAGGVAVRVEADVVARSGGAWLAAARSWMQANKINGSDVLWGSSEVLRPSVTVREIEQLAACVAAAAINEDRRKRHNAGLSGPSERSS